MNREITTYPNYGCAQDVDNADREISYLKGLLASVGRWQPLSTAPKDGTYILLAGPSGYITTPLRVEVCKYDGEYRPLQPWITFSNDSFMDGGEAPTHWMPLPPLPQ